MSQENDSSQDPYDDQEAFNKFVVSLGLTQYEMDMMCELYKEHWEVDQRMITKLQDAQTPKWRAVRIISCAAATHLFMMQRVMERNQ